MEDLYERLTGLLGRPCDQATFQNLVNDLNEAPEARRVSVRRTEYLFKENGFQLVSRNETFESVFLHFGTAPVESGSIKKYSGNLPAEVRFGDDISVVEAKLGVQFNPSRFFRRNDEDRCEKCRFGQLEASFYFRGREQTLRSIGVRLADGS